MFQRSSRHSLELELFPFISLFLCVIGVLAFLQNLLVVGEIGASEEEAKQPQIFQTAYRIECYSDKLVLHPPSNSLDNLYALLTLEEQSGLALIVQRRKIDEELGGVVLNFLPEFDAETLEISLNELVTINQLSDSVRLPYEEYVLFDIHAGGADVYHYVRALLDEPAYRTIRSGLDISNAGAAIQ